jgi:hypothetical protein
MFGNSIKVNLLTTERKVEPVETSPFLCFLCKWTTNVIVDAKRPSDGGPRRGRVSEYSGKYVCILTSRALKLNDF